MSVSETVLREIHQGVLKITLSRPKANAFNDEMIEALQKAFRDAARDKQVRCVLLTASGHVFSAGQDVKAPRGGPEFSFRRHLQQTYNPLVLQIRQLEKPVIAAVNGAAAGAGLGIALACDMRIAAQSARFVVGFIGIGLACDSAVSLFLPTLIGIGRAAECVFMNEPVQADQALEWGLVNRVVPDSELQERAFEWAAQLAQGPIHAMGLVKRDFNKSIYWNLEQVLDYEAHNQEVAGQGQEHKEGVQAFREKRPAQYV